jgi:flagellar hook-basal body complex protein FliE
MEITPIGPASLADSVAGSPEGSSVTAGVTFARLLNDFLSKANTQQTQADQGIMDLAAGKTDNLHRVFLDIIKSDLNVRMVLEIRNRLIEGFQQVLQMQV